MIKKILFIPLIICSLTTYSQKFKYTTHTYLTDDSTYLQLDFFRPDSANEPTPLVIFIHGGGFSNGQREHGHPFCQVLSDSGIASATISYSLYMEGKSFSCNGILSEKVRAIQLAAYQARIATQWFIDNAYQMGIDTTKILLAGSSAGAEAALQAAYWDYSVANFFPDTLSPCFNYAGVISGAGALLDINMINEDTKIPSIFYHGTCDPLVPYHIAPHHYCSQIATGYMMLFGSLAMHDRLTELNENSHLMTYCGDGHQHAGTPFYGPEISTVVSFINRTLNGEKFNVHRVFKNGKVCDMGLDFVFCY